MTFVRHVVLDEIRGVRRSPVTGQYEPALPAVERDAAPFGLWRVDPAEVGTLIPSVLRDHIIANEAEKHARFCGILRRTKRWQKPTILRRNPDGSIAILDGAHRSTAAFDLHARGELPEDVELLAYVGGKDSIPSSLVAVPVQ